MKNNSEHFYNRIKKAALAIFAILFWLCIWQITSVIVNNDILLASPLKTAAAIVRLVFTAGFWESLSNSGLRIIAGFLAGCAVGIASAVLVHRFKLFRILFQPVMSMQKSVPVASFVILILIWFGNERLSFIISMLVVIPIMFYASDAGIAGIDRNMMEMAQVFRLPLWSKIKYIFLPAMYPALLGGFRTAAGMSWKSGVAAEVIGQPLHSIGNELYKSKIYLATDEVLAWTVVIVLLSWISEKAFLCIAEHLFPQMDKNAIKKDSSSRLDMEIHPDRSSSLPDNDKDSSSESDMEAGIDHRV